LGLSGSPDGLACRCSVHFLPHVRSTQRISHPPHVPTKPAVQLPSRVDGEIIACPGTSFRVLPLLRRPFATNRAAVYPLGQFPIWPGSTTEGHGYVRRSSSSVCSTTPPTTDCRKEGMRERSQNQQPKKGEARPFELARNRFYRTNFS